MNVLTTTWRQLVRRRLWPVALLLLAATAAVPVLLARNPAPVVAPPTTAAPAETAKADEALAKPVVAKAESTDRSRRRRVLGARKDPFRPAPPPKAKKAKKHAAKKSVAKTAQPTGTTGGVTVPTGGVTTPVSPTPVVTTPAPKKKTYAKGSLIIRFGDASGGLTRMNLPKLGPLPDDENPLLVYTGLTKNGKKAIFLVDDSLDPTGDGDCEPHPSNCETIRLAKGETEFFDLVDPETGAITTQYELDLVDIK